MTIKALLFDFDGVIIETETPIYRSWLELYQSYGFDLPFDLWILTIGTSEKFFDPKEYLQKQVGHPLDWDEILPRRRAREMSLVHNQPPLPGVLDYLKDARRLGLKNCIVSSSSRAWVKGHLERVELLDYFDFFRNRDDVAHTKPDPELFLSALEGLHISPHEAVVFEDSPNGILAAKRAGIFSVAIPNDLTRLLNLDQAGLLIDSLAEMPLEVLLRKIESPNLVVKSDQEWQFE